MLASNYPCIFSFVDPRLLPMDDCILSSLSLPPGTKSVMKTTVCSPALKDSNPPEHKESLDTPFNISSPEKASRRSSETARQRPKDTRDPGSWQLRVRGGNISQERKVQAAISEQPCDETIDLTASNETADTHSAADDNSQSLRGGRVLRKRKLSGGVDVPTKQPVEAAAFL